MVVALALASSGLNTVVDGPDWWFTMMLVAAVVLAAAAATRSVSRARGWPTLAAAIAGTVALTIVFASDTAILWVIPTLDTLEAFGMLETAGRTSIASQQVPADVDTGILYLLCMGIAVIAFLMDTLANLAKSPALAGVPLLGLVLVPSFVRSEFNDPFLFALTATVYLAMLLVSSRPDSRRTAVSIGSIAVIASLVVPIVLPSVTPANTSSGVGGLASGINPILTLGDSLRRGDPSLALTYTTTNFEGVYLRLAVLDNFSGVSWEPTATEFIEANDVASFAPPPGREPAVAATPITTNVAVADILSRWLPVPYAPTSIDGLAGDWSWEPDGLTVRTTISNARNQEYEVESLQIAPSVDQLESAGTTVGAEFERYLALPEGLPGIVAVTARDVVGRAATHYEQAIALQEFFRNGDFAYSLEAPVEQGYDGTGASVLAKFLQEKSGYCIHFASAMATMARTLDIPARVAVGFTPGEAELDADTENLEYRVSTENLHAWPELYFAGIGWIRFEPTPGLGQVPAFAPLAVDDPATADVDESVPPPRETLAPTSTPTATPRADTPVALPDEPSVTDAATTAPPWGWILAAIAVALLATPWALRGLSRRRRLGAVARGSAVDAWREVRATVDDLGLRSSDARTPRQLSADVQSKLDDGARAALARLLDALESEAYAERARGRTVAAGVDVAHPAIATVADVRTVSRSLHRHAPWGSRFMAIALPRSLVTVSRPRASRWA